MEGSNKTYALHLGYKNIEFPTIDSLFMWLEEERGYWAWLTRINDAPYASELYELAYVKQIDGVKSAFFNDPSPRNSPFPINIGNGPYFDRNSEEAKLLELISKKHFAITAYYALIYLNSNRESFFQNIKIRNSLLSRNHQYYKDLAAHIVFSRQDIIDLSFSASGESIESRVKNLDLAIDNAHTNITLKSTQVENSLSDVKNKSLFYFKSTQKRFNRRITAYKLLARKAANDSRDSLKNAHEHLESAQQAYQDQIDIQASVSYWEQRRKDHENGKNIWFGGVMFSMIMTFALLIFYYGLGGVTGLTSSMHEARSVEIASIQSTQVEKQKEKQVSLTDAAGTKTDTKNDPAKFTPNNTVIIADISGALLLLTLMGLLIRICLSRYNAHTHYMNDAAERVVFTKTYIALLSENKLNFETDRKLALDSLFRSCSASQSGEVAFSSPIEMVIKTMSDQAKSR